MPIDINQIDSAVIYGRFGVYNDTLNDISAVSLFNGDVYLKDRLYINKQTVTYVEEIPPLTSNKCIITGQANDWLNGEYIVSSSGGSTTAFYMFDKQPTVFPMNANDWVKILIEVPTVLTGYSITLPLGVQYTLVPISWKLEASNDDSTWVTLANTSDDYSLSFNGSPVSFTVSNTTAYFYFRFTVLSFALGDGNTDLGTTYIQDISIVASTTILSKPPSDCTFYNNGKASITGALSVGGTLSAKVLFTDGELRVTNSSGTLYINNDKASGHVEINTGSVNSSTYIANGQLNIMNGGLNVLNAASSSTIKGTVSFPNAVSFTFAPTVVGNPLITAVDLTGYATTSSLNSYVLTTALTTALTSYATTSSLSSYVLSSALTTTLADYVLTTALTGYATSSSLSTYVTSSALTTKLADYVLTTALTTALTSYATKTSLDSYVLSSALTTTLGSYVLTTALTTALTSYATKTSLDSYVLSSALTTTLASYGKLSAANTWSADQTFGTISATKIVMSDNSIILRGGNDLNHYLKYSNLGGTDGPEIAGYGTVKLKLTNSSITNNATLNAAGFTINGSLIANNNFSVGGTMNVVGTSSFTDIATFNNPPYLQGGVLVKGGYGIVFQNGGETYASQWYSVMPTYQSQNIGGSYLNQSPSVTVKGYGGAQICCSNLPNNFVYAGENNVTLNSGGDISMNAAGNINIKSNNTVIINGSFNVNGTATFADIHVTTQPPKDTSTGVASTAFVRKACIAGSLGVSSGGFIGSFPICGSVSDLSVLGIGGRVDTVIIMPGWGIRLWSGASYTGSNCVIDNRGINLSATSGYGNCSFWGYFVGTLMYVTAINSGTLGFGSVVTNPLTGETSTVQSFVTGSAPQTGGVGTYNVNVSLFYRAGDGTKPVVYTYSNFGNGSNSWYSIKVYDANALEYTTNIS